MATPARSEQPRELVYKRPWLYPKQLSAIFEPVDITGAAARYSIIEATTKAGKTIGCLLWIAELAMASLEGRNFWWVAPIRAQAQIAFRRLKRGLPQEVFKANETDLTITIYGHGTIWFKGADHPDSLYGEDVFGCVVDEASRVKQEAWHAVRTTLTATRGPIRIIGNVKGRKNWFYAMARQAEGGAPRMSYHKITAADAIEAKIIAADEVEDARRLLPEQVFKELYLAEPSDDGGNPFGLSAIEAALAGLSNKKPAAWGWDLAKKQDWTVGTALDEDGRVCRFVRFQKPWLETISMIHDATGDVQAAVDATGVGDPVVEALQRGHGNYEGYVFTSISKQQLMEGLAVAIQTKEVSVLDGIMRSELEIFEYEYTRAGVRYSAPEGFHDDCVCSLALARHKLRQGFSGENVMRFYASMIARMEKQDADADPGAPDPLPWRERDKQPPPPEANDLDEVYRNTRLGLRKTEELCVKCKKPIISGTVKSTDGIDSWHVECPT